MHAIYLFLPTLSTYILTTLLMYIRYSSINQSIYPSCSTLYPSLFYSVSVPPLLCIRPAQLCIRPFLTLYPSLLNSVSVPPLLCTRPSFTLYSSFSTLYPLLLNSVSVPSQLCIRPSSNLFLSLLNSVSVPP